MAKEDATKSLLHNRFLEGLSGEGEASNNVASKLDGSVEQGIKRDIKKEEPLTEINLNQKAESKLGMFPSMYAYRFHLICVQVKFSFKMS